MTARITPQLIWKHGIEERHRDGTSIQKSHLAMLNGPFPKGMFARMTTEWGADGRETLVIVVIQARAPGGKRRRTYSTLAAAYDETFAWAGRILRERGITLDGAEAVAPNRM